MIMSSWYRPLILVFLLMVLRIELNHAAFGDTKIKCMENERQALLSFKHGLVDYYGVLSSWKYQNDSDCCKWRGVECSNLTNHVIKLDLHGTDELQLSGKIGPSLQELSYLNYLDLSSNDLSYNGPIPKHIGSLVNLKYLNLSRNWFSGAIPSSLGNLSNLLILDISYNFQKNANWSELHRARSLEWLSTLYLLRHIDLSYIDLSLVRDWAQVVSNLPHLEVLKVRNCNLSQPVIQFRFDSNIFSAPLQVLDLSYNCFGSSIFPWLFNFSTTLVQLDLSDICLQGYLTNGLGNMTFLTHVDFGYNQELEAVSPNFFENLCNLHSLSFVGNNLQGSFSNFIHNTLPKCALDNLQFLRLSNNKLSGTLPEFSLLPNLKGLDLSANQLHGTVPSSLGQLVYLEFLDLAQNSLEGFMIEAHFSKLTKLRDLVLAENSLVIDVQNDWVPPFQLDSILLKSCKLGPQFPNWLQTQQFSYLDISNASISDIIPSWFWNNLPPKLKFLDLSQNNISGQIPTTSIHFTGNPRIRLSSNAFDGEVPTFILQAGAAELSSNKFSSMKLLCRMTSISPLYFLDFSSNHLSGDLPNCWEKLSNLEVLILSDNDISGEIPNSLGNLSGLQSLHLRSNHFSGKFPTWLKNASGLTVLDLGSNNLSGPIPLGIGHDFLYLSFLSLRSNLFYGGLPLSLCNLQEIYFLDLSMNKITGHIPNCLRNLTTLTSSDSSHEHSRSMIWIPSIDYGIEMSRLFDFLFWLVAQSFGGSYGNVDDMVASWKGREVNVTGATLASLKSIDLSKNHLIGEIPNEIIYLVELVFLNLSRNNLSGEIPGRIGELKSLDFLDLSRNELVGHIPVSISEINRLSVLDLSYNQLSGKIPRGTQLQSFNSTTYMGNHGLCGLPLLTCPWEDTDSFPHSRENRNEGDELLTRGFYFSMAMGYIVGFWVICSSLVLFTTWRYAYFKFMDAVFDRLSLEFIIYSNRIQRFIKHKRND